MSLTFFIGDIHIVGSPPLSSKPFAGPPQVLRVLKHSRSSLHCALQSARFTSTISASRAAPGPVSAVEAGFICDYSGRDLWPQWPRPAKGREWYTTRKGLTLVNAMHITASVFVNGDAGLCGRLHKRTGEDACPGRRDRAADAHLKRNATRSVARDGPRSGGGGDERSSRLWHLGADLLRRVRRAPAEAGVGQDYRRVDDLHALSFTVLRRMFDRLAVL